MSRQHIKLCTRALFFGVAVVLVGLAVSWTAYHRPPSHLRFLLSTGPPVSVYSSLHSISRVSLVDYTGPTVTAGAARYGYTAVHQCSQCQPSSLHCSAECRSRGPTWSAFVQCRLHCLHLGMLRLHTCDRVVTPRIILTISRN